MSAYKTVYIPTERAKSKYGMEVKPNGDQLARDIQACIEENVKNGFALVNTTNINGNYSGSTYTVGNILIFKSL